MYTSVIRQNQPATGWCHQATDVDDSRCCSSWTATQLNVYATVIKYLQSLQLMSKQVLVWLYII